MPYVSLLLLSCWIWAYADRDNSKLFISFDMTSVKDPSLITRLALKFQDHPAQLYVDGNKMMISSFEDDHVNVNAFNWKSEPSRLSC